VHFSSRQGKTAAILKYCEDFLAQYRRKRRTLSVARRVTHYTSVVPPPPTRGHRSPHDVIAAVSPLPAPPVRRFARGATGAHAALPFIENTQAGLVAFNAFGIMVLGVTVRMVA
jgi:hypothetical protein